MPEPVEGAGIFFPTFNPNKNKNMKNNLLKLMAVFLLFLSKTTFSQSIPSYVPQNGLVGWWPFNGNANDESGNRNNGTVNGATLTTDRFGNSDKAYSFDGVNDIIRCIQPGPIGNPVVTTSFWLKSQQSDYAQILGYGSDGEGGKSFRVTMNQNCGSCIAFDNYGSQNGYLTQFANQWDFYTVIYNGSLGASISNSKIYKNGQLLSSQVFFTDQTTTNISNTIPLTFGRFHGTVQTGYLAGSLDDIAIWNRALSEQEIKNLYNANICYQNVTVTDTLLINMHITGFNPITYQNTIKIYPNPTQGNLTIDFGNISFLSGYQMKFTNSVGQQVFQTNISQKISNVNLSSFTTKGIYYVQLIDSKGTIAETKKIVVQ